MSRQIVWLTPASDDLETIEWQIAGDVAAAVRLFALAGVGTIVRMPNPLGADEHRLYVPPDHAYYVLVRYTVDVVFVERVLRSP